MEKKQQHMMLMLCIAFGIWHIGTQWTVTLLSFLHWDTSPQMSVVDIGYIQSFGSICNAIGAIMMGQLVDSVGPKNIFLVSTVITSVYYCLLSMGSSWSTFMLFQLLRVGYHFDAAAEMYVATVTTESERTKAIMSLNAPQAIALFFGPLIGAKTAGYLSIRTSQFIAGIVMFGALVPTLWFFLPNTHSAPKLASARLRPQDYGPLVMNNGALREAIFLRVSLVASYVSFELISRQFLMRNHLHTTMDSALMLLSMACALILVHVVFLPYLQRRHTPRRLLQLSICGLIASYVMANFCTSYHQLLLIMAVQAGAYALAYAEASTQITAAVPRTDVGKATGLAYTGTWLMHIIIPVIASHLANSWHYTYGFCFSALIGVGLLAFVTSGARHVDARAQSVLPVMGGIET